jgi:hypothetical protein
MGLGLPGFPWLPSFYNCYHHLTCSMTQGIGTTYFIITVQQNVIEKELMMYF